jgi:hypothetical protein
MNYDELVNNIKTYAERGTLASDLKFISMIPTMILSAEDRIATDLMVDRQKKVVTRTINQGEQIIAKPVDWLGNDSFLLNTGSATIRLSPRTPEYIRIYVGPSSTGQPRFYGNHDATHWIVGPIPDQEYDAIISYQAKPIGLSPTNSNTWISLHAPNLLLKACLKEAALFLKNWEDAAVFDKEYMSIVPTVIQRDGLTQIDATTRTPKK